MHRTGRGIEHAVDEGRQGRRVRRAVGAMAVARQPTGTHPGRPPLRDDAAVRCLPRASFILHESTSVRPS